MKETLSTYVIREDLPKLDRYFKLEGASIKLNWSMLDLVKDCWIQVTFDVVVFLKMVLDCFSILYRI